jgi:hypothetical protein
MANCLSGFGHHLRQRWIKALAFACATTLRVVLPVHAQEQLPAPPQFVMLAFDGGKDKDFWRESRKFAASNKVHFTYFVSCVYFLADADKNTYIEPRNGAGKSTIGWGGTPAEIAERLKQTAAAMDEHQEIASHGCGHFDGKQYSASMWNSEFGQFNDIMTNAWKHYGDSPEPAGWSDYFSKSGYGGFRAPYLSFNEDALWSALSNMKFVYDTSSPSREGDWPVKDKGLWEFPLVDVRLATSHRVSLTMDYNFYMAQTAAHRGNPKNFQRYEDEVFDTYMAYFKNSYYGNRAPLHIGNHFAQWNGGAYWKAMKRFAKAVCDSPDYPDVQCASYSELVKFMGDHEGELASYQKGEFAKATPALVSAKQAPALHPITLAELHQAQPIDPAQSHRE